MSKGHAEDADVSGVIERLDRNIALIDNIVGYVRKRIKRVVASRGVPTSLFRKACREVMADMKRLEWVDKLLAKRWWDSLANPAEKKAAKTLDWKQVTKLMAEGWEFKEGGEDDEQEGVEGLDSRTVDKLNSEKVYMVKNRHRFSEVLDGTGVAASDRTWGS